MTRGARRRWPLVVGRWPLLRYRLGIRKTSFQLAVPGSQLGHSPTTRANGQRLLHDQIRDFRLLDFQVGLRFQDFAHLEAVGLLVALGARRPDRRAAGSVEQAELDADRVRDLAHDAAQGVHLADQVPLGNAADGRIAGHLGDEIDVEGVERRLQAHAGCGHGGFAAGVSGADYDYIELFGEGRHGQASF